MLAHWEQSRAQLAYGHQGQFPSTVVSFNLAPGKALGDAVIAVQRVEKRINMPLSINATFQGTAAAFQTSLSNEPLSSSRHWSRFILFSVFFTRATFIPSPSSPRCLQLASAPFSRY